MAAIAGKEFKPSHRHAYFLFLTMGVGVAAGAQRDQVLFGVVARATPKLLVMDLQV